MHTLTKSLLSIVALGAFTGFAFCADTAKVPEVDQTASYASIATAKAKAEVAMTTLTAAIDNRTNGLQELRSKIESSRQKSYEIYDRLRSNEESKGELKDKDFLAGCLANRAKLETASNASNETRNGLEQTLSLANDQFGALRNAYSSAENLDRSFKDARLDLAVVTAAYPLIETKAKSVEASVKLAMTGYQEIGQTWEGLLDEATKFSK